MSIPRVVVHLKTEAPQQVERVFIDGQEVRVSNVRVERHVNDLAYITLTIPGEYVEIYRR